MLYKYEVKFSELTSGDIGGIDSQEFLNYLCNKKRIHNFSSGGKNGHKKSAMRIFRSLNSNITTMSKRTISATPSAFIQENKIQYVFAPHPTPSLSIVHLSECISSVSLPIYNFPVRRIFCVWRNYKDHASEMGHDQRDPPFFFLKPAASSLVDVS